MRYTQLLKNINSIAPSAEPLEDELTRKVDYIFSTFIKVPPTDARIIGAKDSYVHPRLNIFTRSTAPYNIRYLRKEITQLELAWIEKLYNILQDVDAYYTLKDIKPTYYLKVYEASSPFSGDIIYVVKVSGSVEGIKNLLEGTIYEEIDEEEYTSRKNKSAIYHNKIINADVHAEFSCIQ